MEPYYWLDLPGLVIAEGEQGILFSWTPAIRPAEVFEETLDTLDLCEVESLELDDGIVIGCLERWIDEELTDFTSPFESP